MKIWSVKVFLVQKCSSKNAKFGAKKLGQKQFWGNLHCQGIQTKTEPFKLQIFENNILQGSVAKPVRHGEKFNNCFTTNFFPSPSMKNFEN